MTIPESEILLVWVYLEVHWFAFACSFNIGKVDICCLGMTADFIKDGISETDCVSLVCEQVEQTLFSTIMSESEAAVCLCLQELTLT